MESRKCIKCGKEFIPCHSNRKKCYFCSPEREKFIAICKICGKEFLTSSSKRVICYDKHPAVCCICGKEIEDLNWKTERDKATCSKECSNKKRTEAIKKSNLEKYGVTTSFKRREVIEKRERTMLERYGGTCTLSKGSILRDKYEKTMQERYGSTNSWKSPEIRAKFEQTMIERYGTISPLGLPEVREKIKQTNLERYGVSCNLQVPEIKEKIKQTNLERYGAENPWSSDIVQEKAADTKEQRYGFRNLFQSPEVMKKAAEGRRNHISSVNREFVKYLSDCGIETVQEFFIYPFSFDLLVKGKMILLEINPTISHNCHWTPWEENGKDELYHFHKTQVARENGYICIPVWDWTNKEEVVDIVRNIEQYEILQRMPVRVWSRDTEIKYDIDVSDPVSFIKQGWLPVFTDGQLFIKKGALSNGTSGL